MNVKVNQNDRVLLGTLHSSIGQVVRALKSLEKTMLR